METVILSEAKDLLLPFKTQKRKKGAGGENPPAPSVGLT